MVFTFTSSQVLAVLGAIVLINSAIAVVVNWVSRIRNPNRIQDDRISRLEKWKDEMELQDRQWKEEMESRDRENKKYTEELASGSRYMQQAILALLSMQIDGSGDESARRARDDLQQYLINRK